MESLNREVFTKKLVFEQKWKDGRIRDGNVQGKCVSGEGNRRAKVLRQPCKPVCSRNCKEPTGWNRMRAAESTIYGSISCGS